MVGYVSFAASHALKCNTPLRAADCGRHMLRQSFVPKLATTVSEAAESRVPWLKWGRREPESGS